MAPRCIEADIGGQSALAHAQAAGQNNEVRRLQAAQPAIKVGKARGHSGDAAIVVTQQLGALSSLAQRLVQGLHPAP
jgi:hypothetical protein